MTVTAATLKARFTEFAPTDDALVAAVIAEARQELDPAVFGATLDTAVSLLAAHKLALSPAGQPARLEGTAADPSSLDRTTYGADLKRLLRARAGGVWTIGAWGLP